MSATFNFIELNEDVKKGETSSPFDFYIDTDKVVELSKKISALEKKFDDLVNEMCHVDIKKYWSGTESDAFVAKFADTQKMKDELCAKLSKLSKAYFDLATYVEDNNNFVSKTITGSD